MACDDAQSAEDALNAAVSGPKRVKGDAGEVEQHSIRELIEADKYQRSKCAGRTRTFGLRIRQGRLPSATGRNCAD